MQYLTDPNQATDVTTLEPEFGPLSKWNVELQEWEQQYVEPQSVIQTVEIDGVVSRTGYNGESSASDPLKAEILAVFPGTDLTKAHNLSKTAADAHYAEDIISVYFAGGIPQDIISEFNINPIKESFSPVWSTKFLMSSKTRKIKIIDNAYGDYIIPSLPINAKNMGVTIQYDSTGLVDEMDVYFTAEPDAIDTYVSNHPVPGHSISDNRNKGLYGITYKPSTGELIKIKRYFMELAPGIEFK
jgi:hypothetical protein